MTRAAGILLFASLGRPLFADDPTAMLNAARSAGNIHDVPAAEAAYDSALKLAEPGRRLSAIAVEVATFYAQEKNSDRAEEVLKQALDKEDGAQVVPLDEIPVLMRLAEVYSQERRFTDQASAQKRLASAWESGVAPDAVVVANTLHRLARTQMQSGDLAGAKESINRAIEILEMKYGDVPATANAFATLGLIERGLGNPTAEKAAMDRGRAIAQKQPMMAAEPVSHTVTAPRVIDHKDPEYSEEARKTRIQGTIDLSLVVDEKGDPQDVTVVIPLGAGLDEKALEAVRAWRFQPGRKNGVPVPVRATVQINLRLL